MSRCPLNRLHFYGFSVSFFKPYAIFDGIDKLTIGFILKSLNGTFIRDLVRNCQQKTIQ